MVIGDKIRSVGKTAQNDTSSRSHAIFTIYIEQEDMRNKQIKQSKLNLVDLAGSEKINKSDV